MVGQVNVGGFVVGLMKWIPEIMSIRLCVNPLGKYCQRVSLRDNPVTGLRRSRVQRPETRYQTPILPAGNIHVIRKSIERDDQGKSEKSQSTYHKT